MSKSLGRLCLGAGFLMYVASFWLTAVGGPGVGTIKPPSIADLAIDSLLIRKRQPQTVLTAWLVEILPRVLVYHF